MPNPIFLTPVSEDDPCGPDLRWDADFLALGDKFAAAAAQGAAAVVDGEVEAAPEGAFDEVAELARSLSERTKDVRVLAIHAEASWHQGGLVAFADAMEDLAGALETWPGGEDGIHPRADEVDGDLGERAAALGKLLNQIPPLCATVGWSGQVSDAERVASAAALKDVFGSWTARLEPAFGTDLPSSVEAWRALQALVGPVAAPAAAADDETAGDVVAVPPPTDAWDLVDQALERMVEQDHHSPALPLLRLLSSWRTLGIIDIADRMRGSGVTLEQLLASVKQQTQDP